MLIANKIRDLEMFCYANVFGSVVCRGMSGVDCLWLLLRDRTGRWNMYNPCSRDGEGRGKERSFDGFYPPVNREY